MKATPEDVAKYTLVHPHAQRRTASMKATPEDVAKRARRQILSGERDLPQ